MRIIECEQGSQEWLEARLGIPTASNFATVMAKGRDGKSPSVTRGKLIAKLVVERLTGKVLEGFENFSTRQGKEREPLARRAYYLKTGNLVEEVGFCRHDTLACGSSPDGLIDDDGGLEVKCPELHTHMEYLKLAGMPPEYWWQVQGNLWVTGRRWWDFVSWNPDFPEHLQLMVRRVKPSNDAFVQLETELKRFISEVDAEERALRVLENTYE